MTAQAAPDPASVLSVRKLCRTLGTRVSQAILQDIDLEVQRGEFVALTGPSGSGKSTLLYLLGALDRPTSGQILFAGRDIAALSDNERAQLRNEKLGFVFQFHFLLPEFTALENVMLPLLRRGLTSKAAQKQAASALSYLGLAELLQRRPGELSGGQQQRVSIARALAGEPAMLLADEPTGSLDSRNGALVMEQFQQLNRERGMTVIVATHDPVFAARASRCILLKDGRVSADRRRSAHLLEKTDDQESALALSTEASTERARTD